MSLEIPVNYITDLEKFKWGEEWRALVLTKEQRGPKEFFFAHIVKFYGVSDKTFNYDIGTKYDEYAFVGRIRKFMGKTEKDLDPDSPTCGQRITFPPETEEIEYIDFKGKTRKKEILIKGRPYYDFIIPVNKANIEKMKTLIGPITQTKNTTFKFVYGSAPPISVSEEIFFTKTVDEIKSAHIMSMANIQNNKNNDAPK